MKPNRLLKAAAWLWALAVISAAMLPEATLAKYTAQGTGSASARVAKWDPFEWAERRDDDDGEPIKLLLKATAGSRTSTITLHNDSEVTARYVLASTVAYVKPVGTQDGEQAKTAFLDAIAASLNANADYNNGITLGYVGQATATAMLSITIPDATFTGLEITASAEQVD